MLMMNMTKHVSSNNNTKPLSRETIQGSRQGMRVDSEAQYYNSAKKRYISPTY